MKEMLSCRTWCLLSILLERIIWVNYLEVIVLGAIIRRKIIQAPIVRVAILLETIVWGTIIRGELSWGAIVQGSVILGGNCLGWSYPGGIIRRAIAPEPLNLETSWGFIFYKTTRRSTRQRVSSFHSFGLNCQNLSFLNIKSHLKYLRDRFWKPGK